MPTRHLVLRRICLALIAVVAACQRDITTSPIEPEITLPNGLLFRATISRNVIAVGDTALLRFELKNPRPVAVTLTFGSGCPTLPYITRGDEIVYPSGGGWMCTAVVTRLELAPGESRFHDVVVHGGEVQPAIHTGAFLPVGSFSAYAELTNGDGRSNRVFLQVVR